MLVTGYKLREARKRWLARKDVASKTFTSSLWQFEGDNHNLQPIEISQNFERAELAIATLEEAQQKYNQQISLQVHGKTITLALAIKRVGGAARLAKMWRTAATDSGQQQTRYSYGSVQSLTRKQDEVHAKKMVDSNKALELAEKWESFASDLRAEMATANATSLDIDIDPAYIE